MSAPGRLHTGPTNDRRSWKYGDVSLVQARIAIPNSLYADAKNNGQQKPIHLAATWSPARHIDAVCHIAWMTTDLNESGNFGHLPLLCAIGNRSGTHLSKKAKAAVECIRAVVANGASIDHLPLVSYCSPLKHAIINSSSPDVFNELLRLGAHISPLEQDDQVEGTRLNQYGTLASAAKALERKDISQLIAHYSPIAPHVLDKTMTRLRNYYILSRRYILCLVNRCRRMDARTTDEEIKDMLGPHFSLLDPAVIEYIAFFIRKE